MNNKSLVKVNLYLLCIAMLFPINIFGQLTTVELLLIISIFVLTLKGGGRVPAPRDITLYILLVTYTLFSFISLLAVDIQSYRSFGYIINFAFGILFSLVIYAFLRRLYDYNEEIIEFYIYVTLIASLLTINEFIFYPSYDIHGNLRTGGGSLHGPSYGAIFVIGCLLSVYAFTVHASRAKKKAVYIINLILSAVGLFLTNTRTWLLVLAVLSLISLARINNFFKYVIVPCSIILFIIYIPNFQTNTLPHEVIGSLGRYQLLLNFDLYDNNPRLLKWNLALGQVEDNILIGVGAFNLNLSTMRGVKSGGVYQSDSFYVDALAYDGVIGFILMIIVFFYIIFKINQINYSKEKLLARYILYAWLIGGLFWNYLITYNVYLFFFTLPLVISLYENEIK